MGQFIFIVLPQWLLILKLSFIQELFFWRYKAEIFDWNPENGFMHPVNLTINPPTINKVDDKEVVRTTWRDRRDTYKNLPMAWIIYRFSLETIGIFVGWNLIFFTVNKFISMQAVRADIGGLWNLLFTLILGLIGIAGRIPVIIDSVQDWFKK